MGNVLSECRQLPRIDQCEICTHVQQDADVESRTPHDAGRQVRDQADASNQARGFNPPNMSEAEALQHVLRISRMEAEQAGILAQPQAGHPAGLQNGSAAASSSSAGNGEAGSGAANGQQQREQELLAQAIKNSKLEESRERERLRQEQAREYQESLLIDQQREAERQRRLQEEEEEKQRKEREREEAVKAEEDRKARVTAIIEEARARIQPEPPTDEKVRVQVQVRVPDGRKFRRFFRPTDPVSQVYDYINAEGGEAVASIDYVLVAAMPRAVYSDREKTLEDAGMKGQCALLVETLD